MGFPQVVDSRLLAGIRASHYKLVGAVLSSLPTLLRKKISALALPCVETSALV